MLSSTKLLNSITFAQYNHILVDSPFRPQGSKWFRFDDGEVIEAKIDDEEVIFHILTDTHAVVLE